MLGNALTRIEKTLFQHFHLNIWWVIYSLSYSHCFM